MNINNFRTQDQISFSAKKMNEYFTDGIIKKIDIKNETINIVSDNIVKHDPKNNFKEILEDIYNVWVQEEKNGSSEEVELKEAILLKSNIDIDYSNTKDRIKSVLTQITQKKSKVRFHIRKNGNKSYKLINVVINNE